MKILLPKSKPYQRTLHLKKKLTLSFKKNTKKNTLTEKGQEGFGA